MGREGHAQPRPGQAQGLVDAAAEAELGRGALLDELPLEPGQNRRTAHGVIEDEPLPRQVLQPEGGPAGQGTLPGTDADQRDPGHLLVDYGGTFPLLEVVAHYGLHLLVLQQPVEVGEGDHPELGTETGELSHQVAQDLGKGREHGEAVTADGKLHDVLGGGALQTLFGPLGDGQDAPGVVDELESRLGQGHLLGGPAKELGPQLILQGADLVGHRRLGQAELLRRPGKVEKIRHGHKTLQLCGIHPKALPLCSKVFV